MSLALVVVDIQNDYFAGGAMPLEGADAAAENAARLLARFRAEALPIVHVRHASTHPGATYLVPGMKGGELHDLVAPVHGETIIDKNFPNAFRATPLLAHLRDIGARRLLFAGMMTHMCIDTSVRAAFDHGYACALAHDACATRALKFRGEAVPAAQVHAAFVAALHGLFAEADTTANILAGPMR